MDIYGIIDSLRKNTGNNDLLKKLADILEKHVRFEERELFNYLQANVPESTLLEIASLLRSRKHEPDSAWSDAFRESFRCYMDLQARYDPVENNFDYEILYLFKHTDDRLLNF